MKDQEERKSEIIVNFSFFGLITAMWLAADQLCIESVYKEN
jgi:hypothetical protein